MDKEDWEEQLEEAIRKSFFVKEATNQRNKQFFDRKETEQTERNVQSKEEKHNIYSPDPLVWAVENNHWELFNLLMERNDMDINKEDSEGKTAVTAAILNNRIELLKEDLSEQTNFNSRLQGILELHLKLLSATRIKMYWTLFCNIKAVWFLKSERKMHLWKIH
jgi:ankyrin repeat protein